MPSEFETLYNVFREFVASLSLDDLNSVTRRGASVAEIFSKLKPAWQSYTTANSTILATANAQFRVVTGTSLLATIAQTEWMDTVRGAYTRLLVSEKQVSHVETLANNWIDMYSKGDWMEAPWLIRVGWLGSAPAYLPFDDAKQTWELFFKDAAIAPRGPTPLGYSGVLQCHRQFLRFLGAYAIFHPHVIWTRFSQDREMEVLAPFVQWLGSDDPRYLEIDTDRKTCASQLAALIDYNQDTTAYFPVKTPFITLDLGENINDARASVDEMLVPGFTEGDRETVTVYTTDVLTRNRGEAERVIDMRTLDYSDYDDRTALVIKKADSRFKQSVLSKTGNAKLEGPFQVRIAMPQKADVVTFVWRAGNHINVAADLIVLEPGTSKETKPVEPLPTPEGPAAPPDVTPSAGVLVAATAGVSLLTWFIMHGQKRGR
jgi:hypothetical protein